MPIANRTLPAGAFLTARYKGADHTLLVLENDGRLAFELDGETIYRSLSAAGSAVMGGTACNGWRFWSLPGEQPPAADGPTPRRNPTNGNRGPRGKRPGGSQNYRGWSTDRLTRQVESIERDLPALDGDVLLESQSALDALKAELLRRADGAEA